MNNKYIVTHMIISILIVFICGAMFSFNSVNSDAFSILAALYYAVYFWVISVVVIVFTKSFFIKRGIAYLCPILPTIIFIGFSLLIAESERLLLYILALISTIINFVFFYIRLKKKVA